MLETMCANLRQLNKELVKRGYNSIIFVGYIPTGRAGTNGEKTRHYLVEREDGVTIGGFFEIRFNAENEDFLID